MHQRLRSHAVTHDAGEMHFSRNGRIGSNCCDVCASRNGRIGSNCCDVRALVCDCDSCFQNIAMFFF